MAEKKNVYPENLWIYEKLRKVPAEAKKEIKGGRLQGMTDVNPVWRIKALTDAFGPCGFGWKYEIVKQWQETFGQEVKSFTNINLYVRINGEWSEPIPGTGGATLVEVNSKGYAYVNDEGHKMSLTDALSVAMKALGMAADVYFSKDAKADNNAYDNKYAMYYQQQAVAQQQASVQKQTQLFDFKAAIANCKDVPSLMALWNNNPALQQNSDFRSAWTTRRSQLN